MRVLRFRRRNDSYMWWIQGTVWVIYSYYENKEIQQ